MTSKEIIQRTLDFTGPERVARSFDNGDFAYVDNSVKTHATPWEKVDDIRWKKTDGWGNTWSRIDDTSRGEVTHGVLESLDELENYVFPDYSNPKDYDLARQKRADFPDKWLIAGLEGFAFSIARKMRKMDTYLMDLYLDPERMSLLHDKVDALLSDMIVNYAAAGADSIMFWEDWGTQDQLLIDPEKWHEEFYPRFEKLCNLCHEKGLKVIMHSCGEISAIIPSLIKAGVDVLQLDQPTLHGIDTLAEYQKDNKITFWCPVDVQKTLQTEDEAYIRAEAREMIEKLSPNGRGGFIAGFYYDNESLGMDPKWQNYALDEFIKVGGK